MDLDSHLEEGAFFYILSDNLDYNLILELSWLQQHNS